MGIMEEYGQARSKYPAGELNQITDVPGVSIGHCTLRDGSVQTGVTAVIPHPGNCFREKCVAAAHVINGFGKGAGLMQIQELGTLETPILLTNTMSIGTVSTALTRYMLEKNPDIGVTTTSVNPVVLECNDGRLNDIRGMHVTEEHARMALENAENSAGSAFEEGAVGAGAGMICYGLKGGIGSSSRIITVKYRAKDAEGNLLTDKHYTVGTLVLSNFGRISDLVVYGEALGEKIEDIQKEAARKEKETGSVIVIVATDAPLSARQLGRVARRAQNGIARTGATTAGDSGEAVVCFSTANKQNHYPKGGAGSICTAEYLHEYYLDAVFAAVSESVEESIISSLMHADIDKAIEGKVHSLKEYPVF